ncbi:MAG TPA: phage holin family protein [Williamwhitmania sp.]|nr:phage holin family protein [Williamwhitmania sp.]
MEDKIKLVETLLERATELGKTSFELAKLKALDKTSDVVSSLIPHFIVLLLVASFLLFFNLGAALLIGKILGEIYWGFLVVAIFYLFVALVIYFLLRKWFKRVIGNFIVKQVLK